MNFPFNNLNDLLPLIFTKKPLSANIILGDSLVSSFKNMLEYSFLFIFLSIKIVSLSTVSINFFFLD